MCGDTDMDDSPALVCEKHEHEQQATSDRRDDEEIGCHDLIDVSGHEGAPRLGGRCRRPPDVLRNGGL